MSMDQDSINDTPSLQESTKDGDEEKLAEEEIKIDPRSLLTREQVDFFREVFDAIDVDKKGKIPAKMMGYVLRSLGFNPTKADIKKHIQQIDPNNKGTIDFYSFLLPIAERIDDQPETHEDIIAAFKVLDEQGLDYITTDQLNDFMTTLGEELEDFEMELLLKMSETKGTGRIYYVEFVEKMFGIVKPKDPKKSKKSNY